MMKSPPEKASSEGIARQSQNQWRNYPQSEDYQGHGRASQAERSVPRQHIARAPGEHAGKAPDQRVSLRHSSPNLPYTGFCQDWQAECSDTHSFHQRLCHTHEFLPPETFE